MNSDKNNIDKIIKAKIGDHEMMPDDAVWNSIQSSLVKPAKYAYLYKGIITAVVCSTVLSLFYMYKSSEKKQLDTFEKRDSIKQQTEFIPDNTGRETDLKESNASSYISKDILINRSVKEDSFQVAATLSTDSILQPVKDIVVSADTSAFISTPIKNTMPKKVIKKPLYVIKQDTIYKIDTLKRKKIK